MDDRRVDRVEVLDSTDPDLPPVIYVDTSNSCSEWYSEGGDHFMALSGASDTFTPPDLARNALWGVPDGPEGDTEWAWMCDIRLLLAQDGVLTGANRQEWIDRMQAGTVRESRLALTLLEQLQGPTIDPMALAAAISRHFEEVPNQTGRGHDEFEFLNLYQAAAMTIARSGDGEAAKMLADIYWADQLSTRMLAANGTDCLVVSLLLVPPGQDNVGQLAALLGTRLETSAQLVESFARVPGEPVRELLWRMIEDPRAYGIQDSWPLEAVWGGLASRKDPALRLYLKAHVSQPDMPDLGVKIRGRVDDVKKAAQKHYHAVPPTEEERLEDVRELADEIAAGDLDLCPYLGPLLRPEDRGLAETLGRVRIENGGPRYTFLRDIISAIPDPAFIPLLRSRAEEAMHSWPIEALLDCGGMEDAIRLVAAHMQEPLVADGRTRLSGEVVLRATLLSVLLDSGAGDRALPWVRACFLPQDVEEPWVPPFREALRSDDATIRRARFSLLLAFVKADPEHALPVLVDEYERYKTGRDALAICLHHLGDNRGRGYVNEFLQQSTELTHEQLKRIYDAVRYLEDPALDALVLERFQRAGLADIGRWYWDTEFIDRLGLPLMHILLSTLEDPANAPAALVVCESYFKTEFGYDEIKPRAVRDAAVAACAVAVRERIAALEAL